MHRKEPHLDFIALLPLGRQKKQGSPPDGGSGREGERDDGDGFLRTDSAFEFFGGGNVRVGAEDVSVVDMIVPLIALMVAIGQEGEDSPREDSGAGNPP